MKKKVNLNLILFVALCIRKQWRTQTVITLLFQENINEKKSYSEQKTRNRVELFPIHWVQCITWWPLWLYPPVSLACFSFSVLLWDSGGCLLWITFPSSLAVWLVIGCGHWQTLAGCWRETAQGGEVPGYLFLPTLSVHPWCWSLSTQWLNPIPLLGPRFKSRHPNTSLS